jgi:hypothetical protein
VIAFKGGRISAGGKRTGLGTGFGSLVSYLKHGPESGPDPNRVAWTSYRNLDGIEDPTLAGRLMRAHAEENPRVERPVYHFGLSLSPGEHLTPDAWNAAVDRVLQAMGLSEHQTLVVAHGDTDREHVHVVVNRVGEDGRAWDPRQDMVKAYAEVHALEAEHRLRATGERPLAPPELSESAHQEARRTGQQPLADRVREEAGPALARATSWRDLEEQLALHGFRLESAERGSGVIVTDGNRRASFSHVDRTLSGPKLAERFGETFREYRAHHPEPPPVQAPPGRATAEHLPGTHLAERAAALIERVSATRATFTEADVKRAAFHQPDSAALVREALQSEHAVEIGRDSGGATRYTTLRYLEAEAGLFTTADRLAGRADLCLDPEGVARMLQESAPHLSDEQKAAVFHATTRADLAQIVGRAGAGKTTTARTIAWAYRGQGYDVRGAALAGKAAEGLQNEAGIPSRTLASLEKAWSQGHERLHGGTVLIVDEAGMVDTRQLGRVLQEADRAGAKVILLGDPDQLKAIGAGDAYRGLLERHACAHVTEIRRQAEPWQREASENLARGRITPALDAYDAAGRLHWSASPEQARRALVARYLAERGSAPDSSRLIVAYRNEDARKLNEAIRAGRRAAGELGPGVAVGGTDYAPGDRIVFLRNDNTGREVANLDDRPLVAGVKNGTLGTVEQVEARRFVARLDDGRRVEFDPLWYPTIAHGYAVTVHKSQGATVDRTYVLAGPGMNQNASYVALTRHREGVHIYADRKTFGDRNGLDHALSRPDRKDLARDYAAADLERVGSRVTAVREQAKTLRREEQSLTAAIGTVKTAEVTGRELEATRVQVERAAAAVYTDPRAAMRALLADPRASDRLAAGEAAIYGQLRGQVRLLFGRDSERGRAESAISSLRGALWNHGEASQRHARAHGAAASIGSGLFELKAQLDRVRSTLRKVEALAERPERVLEVAVRAAGHTATRAALSLLPTSIQIPVRALVRAAELALGRGFGR